MSAEVYPLDGITVVEVASGKAAKLATRFLAGYGAAVSTADQPGGTLDEARRIFFDAGKSAVTGEVPDAVRSADVLVTDLTVAGREELGIGPAVTDEADTIVIAVTPYGESGVGSDRPASELTQFASGGQMATLGDVGREPLQAYGSQAEAQAALHVFGAVMAALIRRRRHGIESSAVDISVQEVQASALEFFGGVAFNRDPIDENMAPKPGGNSMHALWAMYECADGLVGVHVNAPNMVPFFNSIGRPDLLERASDDAFVRSDELREIVSEWVRPKTKDEFMKVAQEFGVPFSYVATPTDLLESDIVASTGLWREVTLSDGRVLRVPGPMNESSLQFDHVRAQDGKA